MVTPLFQRRRFLTTLSATVLLPQIATAADFLDLEWSDLLPVGEVALPPVIQELLQHDPSAMAASQPASSGVRSDWNGKTVRLPGYVVPIEYSGSGVTSFILVPFVGACVHVPPPPANQLVFVTTQTPFESQGLYQPVDVIGVFNTTSVMTEIATAGYTLDAKRVVPYRG